MKDLDFHSYKALLNTEKGPINGVQNQIDSNNN